MSRSVDKAYQAPLEIDLDPLELFEKRVAHECDMLAVSVEHGERVEGSGTETRALEDTVSELDRAAAGTVNIRRPAVQSTSRFGGVFVFGDRRTTAQVCSRCELSESIQPHYSDQL